MKRYATEPGFDIRNPSSVIPTMAHVMEDTNVTPVPQRVKRSSRGGGGGGGYTRPIHPRESMSAVTLPSSASASASSLVISPSPRNRLSFLPHAPPSAFEASRRHAGDIVNSTYGMMNHGNHSMIDALVGRRGSTIDVSRHHFADGGVGRQLVTPSTPDLPFKPSTTDLPASPRGERESKLRRASRVGLAGIRDLLKNLKKTTQEERDREYAKEIHPGVAADTPPEPRRMPKSSSGPPVDLPRPATSQSTTHHHPLSNTARKSPRRPSLASIFRLGNSHSQKASKQKVSGGNTSSAAENSTTEDDYSDWDRMDSASDLDIAGHDPERKGRQQATERESRNATVKGRKAAPVPPSAALIPLPSSPPSAPYRLRAFTTSQTSLAPSLQASHSSHLPAPITEEAGKTPPAGKRPIWARQHRSQSRNRSLQVAPAIPAPIFSSVRGLPSEQQQPQNPHDHHLMSYSTPEVNFSTAPVVDPPEIKLALTPENIKPLLEYAKEVSSRLNECVLELRGLGAVTLITSS